MAKMHRKESRKTEQNEKVVALRRQYELFLEEDRRRKERNSQILRRLDDIRHKASFLQARTNTARTLEWTDDISRTPQPIQVSISSSSHTTTTHPVSSKIFVKRPQEPLYLHPDYKYTSRLSPQLSSTKLQGTFPTKPTYNSRSYPMQYSTSLTQPVFSEQELQKNISNLTIDDIIREISKQYILIPRKSIDHPEKEESNNTLFGNDNGKKVSDETLDWTEKYDILRQINQYDSVVASAKNPPQSKKAVQFERNKQPIMYEAVKTESAFKNNGDVRDEIYHDTICRTQEQNLDEFHKTNDDISTKDNSQIQAISANGKCNNTKLPSFAAENIYLCNINDLNTNVPLYTSSNNEQFQNNHAIPQHKVIDNQEHFTNENLGSSDIKTNEYFEDVNKIGHSEDVQDKNFNNQNVAKNTKQVEEIKLVEAQKSENVQISSQEGVHDRNVHQDNPPHTGLPEGNDQYLETAEYLKDQTYEPYLQNGDGQNQDSQIECNENQDHNENQVAETYPDSTDYPQTVEHVQNVTTKLDTEYGQHFETEYNQNVNSAVDPTYNQNNPLDNKTTGVTSHQHTDVRYDGNVNAAYVSNDGYDQSVEASYSQNVGAAYQNADIAYNQNPESAYAQTVDSAYNQNVDEAYDQSADAAHDQNTYLSSDQNTDVAHNQNANVAHNQNTDVAYDQNTDVAYDQNAEVVYDQNIDIAYGQNADVAYGQNADVAYGQNADVAYDQNTDVAYDQNTDVAYDQNAEVVYDQNIDIAYGQNADVAYGQNADVAYGQNADVAYGQNADVAYDQNADVEYDQNADVAYDQTADVAYDQNADVAYDQNADVAYDQTADVAYDQNADVAYGQNADVVYDQNADVAYDQNADVVYDQNADVVYDQNADVAYDQNADVAYDQNADVAYDQNADVAYGQNADVAYDQNADVVYDQNADVAYGQNADVAYNQNADVAYDQNADVAYGQNADVAYDQNADVAYGQNADVAYGQNADVAYDQNADVAYGQNADVAYNQNADVVYDQNAHETYNQNSDTTNDQNADAGYNPNAEVTYDQNADTPYDQMAAAAYATNTDVHHDKSVEAASVDNAKAELQEPTQTELQVNTNKPLSILESDIGDLSVRDSSKNDSDFDFSVGK